MDSPICTPTKKQATIFPKGGASAKEATGVVYPDEQLVSPVLFDFAVVPYSRQVSHPL
ncbi:hypothetical protein [uncultured Nostoc sp.]|uniref:hypothetical protein n=1 Tax=uncultured Nostoc sp. TaxID=340711 RepID=UPI002615798F|nr:hypothetical protein [uncultured Nostoc sp.]